jgi:hypothetical protein
VSQLSPDERLALAVRAEVTRVRAEAASDQAALLDRRLVPLLEAVPRFARRFRRDPDLASDHDLEALLAFVIQPAGPKLSRSDLEAAAHATREAEARQGLALLAANELARALPAGGGSILEWCGVTEEELLQAVLVALGLHEP